MGRQDALRRLGLTEGATREQIRKAYLRRALQTHPDKHPMKAAEFRAVQEAYEFLRI